MIAAVQNIWEEEYKCIYPSPIKPEQLGFLAKYKRKGGKEEVSTDVFTSYIKGGQSDFAGDEDIDLLGWWMKPKNKWRQLRQIFLDLLSIPAMSVEVERVFSSAKRLVTPDRNRLTDETIEMLELLKY
jgi:hypothetical protein